MLLLAGNGSHAITLIVLAALCLAFGKLAYAFFLHPLRKIPGPWWASLTRIPYMRALKRGNVSRFLQALHNEYGPVVRYTPNEISFTEGDQAWQEIYGFRTGKQRGTASFEKDHAWYAPGIDGVPSILQANDDMHTVLRRGFSHAFSDRSLRDQEPVVQGYVNQLISQLKSRTGEAVDLDVWYTRTTSDVITKLAFGETFGSLAKAQDNVFLTLFGDTMRAFVTLYAMNQWPILKNLQGLLAQLPTMQNRHRFRSFAKDTISFRIQNGSESHDFLTDVLEKRDEDLALGKAALSDPEIISTSNIFLVAGTDTTATALSSATYYLLSNPTSLDKVVHEVRSSFTSSDDFTIERCANLSYMNAVLTEAMRMMPPVPAGFPRSVPSTGAEICGHWIDGGCGASVSVTHVAAYRDEKHFRHADRFAPERWLGDEMYKDDVRSVFQPFNFGPRNCLGKNLAHTEMRLVLAKMLFNFDMTLDAGSRDWFDRCDADLLWHKAGLMVHLTHAK